METHRQIYPTDLTDDQWNVIEPLLYGLRTYKWPKRELINAALYVVKNGIAWRNMPHDFPPWKTVYSFYMRAAKNCLWDRILLQLVEMTRENSDRSQEQSP